MREQFWDTTFAYFWRPELPFVLLLAAALGLLLMRFLATQRRAVTNTLAFFALCLGGQLGASFIEGMGFSMGAFGFHELFVAGSGIALIRLLGLMVFRLVLPALGRRPPRIAEDLALTLAYLAWALVRLRVLGLDLSSIVATSAVITAVIAFAMQDTLGNVLGGIALQLDSSFEIGDWIRVDDVSGRVLETRWRFTAVETRNGETVIFPNSVLMKSKFVVVCGAHQMRRESRRWVWFHVAYATAPARVIEVVEQAAVMAEVPNVASSPLPSCVLMEFGPGYGRYALRFWLKDPLPDDPTDSRMRVLVFAALQRAGIRLAVTEQAIHVTSEGESHRAAVEHRDMERRLAALAAVEMFSGLKRDELGAIAARLVHAPFATGDVITRQGNVAHWLYLLVAGEVDVWFAPEGVPRRHLTTLHAGAVFGEMGLMTGEARRATVTARSDVECYRLDKVGFEQIIRSRPELAEQCARILAERESQLVRVQEQADRETTTDLGERSGHILGKIRQFFALQ